MENVEEVDSTGTCTNATDGTCSNGTDGTVPATKWSQLVKNTTYETNRTDRHDWIFQFFYKSYGAIDVRPIWFDFAPKRLNVEIVMQPKNIMEVKMMERAIKISAYIHLEWFDPRLSWLNLRQFAAISSIDMDSNSVWLPRISLRDGEIEDLNTFNEGSINICIF